MFEIDNTVISAEIFRKEFACDLSACKGACCIDGEAGAPLDEAEVEILKQIKPLIAPFLRQEGVEAIETQGVAVIGFDGEWETALINNAECAYVVFDEAGVAQCGIEKAHAEGAVDWKKPISCHLYPIRVKDFKKLTAINYHKWSICEAACTLGAKLHIPIFIFVKEALIRKFGGLWYDKLLAVYKKFESQPSVKK